MGPEPVGSGEIQTIASFEGGQFKLFVPGTKPDLVI